MATDKILQFGVDPNVGMENLKHNLKRALRIDPSVMDKMIEQDDAERERIRLRAGHKKSGPKPKATSSNND
jgi:hypothetical protein